jgi:phenylacetate-CoA ligase
MGLESRIYDQAPIWLQTVLLSLRGADFRLRRASTRIIQADLQFLRSSQYWPEERLREYQDAQLRRTISRAFEEVPHFRALRVELGCDPEDFRSLDDIKSLPVLEKASVRGNEEQFRSDAYRGYVPYVNRTSGTTGSPMRTFETRKSFSKRWAFVARLRDWAGVSNPIYPRRAQFTGRNIVPDAVSVGGGRFWRNNYAGNALLCSTTHLSPQTVPAFAAALRSFDPELIEGYPSAIAVIARVSLRLGIDLPRPRAVLTSAETLHANQKRDIEAAFRCRVFDQYASSEPSCFWGTCEQGVMHQSSEYGVSEILDDAGNPVGVGEEGSVVVTSFLNPLMPLLRYRLQDSAVRGPDARCNCGRTLPRVERVLGRTDDTLFIPGRGYVGRLDPAFKEVDHLLEVQVIQVALDELQVLVVSDPGFEAGVAATLLQNLRRKVGAEVCIHLQQVDRIPRGANGKFRGVVSSVRHLYPDAV